MRRHVELVHAIYLDLKLLLDLARLKRFGTIGHFLDIKIISPVFQSEAWVVLILPTLMLKNGYVESSRK